MRARADWKVQHAPAFIHGKCKKLFVDARNHTKNKSLFIAITLKRQKTTRSAIYLKQYSCRAHSYKNIMIFYCKAPQANWSETWLILRVLLNYQPPQRYSHTREHLHRKLLLNCSLRPNMQTYTYSIHACRLNHTTRQFDLIERLQTIKSGKCSTRWSGGTMHEVGARRI